MQFLGPYWLYLLSLATLPWVGFGVIHFATGVDVGGGLQLSWLLLAGAILKQGLTFDWSLKERGHWERGPSVSRFLLVITGGTLVVVLISGLGILVAPSFEPLASSWSRWGRQVVQLSIMFAFLLFPALWTKGTRRWQLTLDFLFMGAFFQVLYGVFQEVDFFNTLFWFKPLEQFFTSNPSILSGSGQLYLNNMMQAIPRLRGTICEPLYLGNYLLMVWPFILLWRRPLWLKWSFGILLGALLLLTWSRGAWFGFMVQVPLWILWRRKIGLDPKNSVFDTLKPGSLLSPWLIGGGIALLMVAGNLLTHGFLLQRFLATFNQQDWSNLTRFYSMQAAWQAFLSSPLVGIGWGQFAFHFPALVDSTGLQSQFSWPVVNNFPLQILSETGLLGFLFFLGVGAHFFLQIRRFPRELVCKAVLPATISCVGVWIQLLTFSQYNLPHIWVGMGLLLAALGEIPGRSVAPASEENEK